MGEALSNRDMLDWFSEEERCVCNHCGEHACVSLPEADSLFCFGCGAVTLSGIRLDADRAILSQRGSRIRTSTRGRNVRPVQEPAS
jgi:hypothetical protein